MTVTIDRIETTYDPTNHPTSDPDTMYAAAAPLSGTDLLAVLNDAVASVADVDPDELGSSRPAGRELLRLARLARTAAAGLGRHPGTAVTEAPGVVVVRELVAATRTLAAAIA